MSTYLKKLSPKSERSGEHGGYDKVSFSMSASFYINTLATCGFAEHCHLEKIWPSTLILATCGRALSSNKIMTKLELMLQGKHIISFFHVQPIYIYIYIFQVQPIYIYIYIFQVQPIYIYIYIYIFQVQPIYIYIYISFRYNLYIYIYIYISFKSVC